MELEDLKHRIEHIISRIDNLQVYAIQRLKWYQFRLRKSVENMNGLRDDLVKLKASLERLLHEVFDIPKPDGLQPGDKIHYSVPDGFIKITKD